MTAVTDWLDAWKIADQAAMRATRAAGAKSLLALQRRGDLPSDAERAEARRLRELADELFREWMSRSRNSHASEAWR